MSGWRGRDAVPVVLGNGEGDGHVDGELGERSRVMD